MLSLKDLVKLRWARENTTEKRNKSLDITKSVITFFYGKKFLCARDGINNVAAVLMSNNI